MKKIFISAALVASAAAFAQTTGKVGINVDAPQATLDINPNATNLTGTTNEGILIPRLTAARTAATAAPVEGTMVYVTDAPADATKFTDTTKGFYYWDSAVGTAPVGRWVKMGSGSAAVSTETIRQVAAITATEWNNNQYALSTTTNAAIVLPAAASNKNRIIAVHNDTASSVNYAAPAPVRNSTIQSGKGQLLMSDGSRWYVIAGL